MDLTLKSSFSAYSKSDKELGIYRIVFALYLLVFGIRDFTWMRELPDIFFSPPKMSLGVLFSGFPSEPFLYSLTAVLIISAGFLLFGIWSRFFSYLIVAAFLIGNTFTFSLGKIDHGFLLWIVPLVLASGWGSGYAVSPEKSNSWTREYGPGIVAFIIAFAMFTAGYIKLMGGWLITDTQAVHGHFLREYYVNERQELLAKFFISLDSKLIWESLDYGGVLLELLFLPAFFSRRAFRGFLVFTILFHVLNFFILNIVFIGNYASYALFLSWGPIIAFADNVGKRHIKVFKGIGLFIPVGLLMMMLFSSFTGSTLHFTLMNVIAYFIEIDYVMLVGFTLNTVAILIILFTSMSGRKLKSQADEEKADKLAYT